MPQRGSGGGTAGARDRSGAPEPAAVPAGRRGGRECAVLIPHLLAEGEDVIVLVERPDDPRDPYAGHVCLPGGAREACDMDLASCALREASEELGVDRRRITLFGELDWHGSPLHPRVKPFAGSIPPSCRLRPEPAEVARILYLPRARLRPALFRERTVVPRPGASPRRTPAFELEGKLVWGLTARILLSYACGLIEPLRPRGGS